MNPDPRHEHHRHVDCFLGGGQSGRRCHLADISITITGEDGGVSLAVNGSRIDGVFQC